jgi:vacuolar iron transporter family protein
MAAITLSVQGKEAHRQGTWLRDVILGGQDGLVNVLGIVLGVTAAGGETRILVAAALAAAFAESVSMGAVAYTSSLAQRDHYRRELERERQEIREMPAEEREEIRRIYKAKGFSGALLEEIVNTITANDQIWLESMMSDELHLEAVDTRAVLRTSVVVTIAAVLGSLIPLAPFVVLPQVPAAIGAVMISALALFAVGAFKANSLVGNVWRSGIEMAAIGLGAALVGFVVGRIFGVSG